jgi:hypothetical protein
MRFSRKQFVALAAGTVSLGISVGAFAFFQAPGGGSGDASVGSASAIELSATTAGDLYPGGPARPVTITMDNPGSGNQFVDTVTLASVTSDKANCDTSAFTMADVAVNSDIAAGQTVSRTGSLTMANAGDQDACQGAALTLNLTSN